LAIAIDVMSGDHGPRECVAGALKALREDSQLRALLVGQPTHIEPTLAALPPEVRARAEIVPAAQIVAMDEVPREAIRRHRDSSM
jgi:glycerol-3-phosphate acyltransferase PlsX